MESQISSFQSVCEAGIDLEKRIIYCTAPEFTDEFLFFKLRILKYLDDISDDKITMFVSSAMGGSYGATLALYDAMRSCKNQIVTIGTGDIISSGLTILLGGDIRKCTLNSNGMAHSVLGEAEELEAKALKARGNATLTYQELQLSIFAERTKKSTQFWKRQIDKTGELWMTANEMKRLKIVQEIC